MTDSITQSVCAKFQHRAAVGLKKYGKTMDRNDLTELQWLTHAQEEAMGLVVYLEKLIQSRKCQITWTANTTLPGGIDKDGLSTKEHTQNGKLGGGS